MKEAPSSSGLGHEVFSLGTTVRICVGSPSYELMKKIFRKYGTSPFKVVLVHSGPGAPGKMKPLDEASS